MWIKELSLKHFRNYTDLRLPLEQVPYFIVGQNGHGKTNILEAIAITSYTKSFRTNATRDLVQHGADSFRISVEVEGDEKPVKLEQFLGKNGNALSRTFWKNGAEVPIDDFFGSLKIVVFSPEDINLLLLGPSERRRYLNFLVLQKNPKLLRVFSGYNEVLQQRNALLQRIKRGVASEDELSYWDGELITKGAKIIMARADVIAQVNTTFTKYLNEIADKKSDALVEYKPGTEYEGEEIETALAFGLKEKIRDDIARGTTSVGPHRDNFEIRVDGKNLLSFGSRGELRTALLAMKFSERDMLAHVGKPIILLDDVFSELDAKRRSMVLELSRGHQAFITTCEMADLPEKREGTKILAVNNAKVSPYDV